MTKPTDITTKEEKALVKRAVSGDVDAFCRLYDSYSLRLYRYAFYRLGEKADAEDAVSECFLSAWKRISFLRNEEAFGGWMFRILSTCCAALQKDQIERRKQVSLDQAAEAGPEGPSGEPGGADGTALVELLPLEEVGTSEGRVDDSLLLLDALSILSAEDREIVLLSIVGGFKSNEVGEIIDMKPGSVRSRQSRALAKMREHLERAD